jgi:hypothetical protein
MKAKRGGKGLVGSLGEGACLHGKKALGMRQPGLKLFAEKKFNFTFDAYISG